MLSEYFPIATEKATDLLRFLFTVSAIGTGASNQYYIFIICHILGGICIGLASNLSTMYIAEVAPTAVRGNSVSTNQLNIVVGILLAQLANSRACCSGNNRCRNSGIVEWANELALDVLG